MGMIRVRGIPRKPAELTHGHGAFNKRHPASSLRHRRVYLVIEFWVVTIGQRFRPGSKMGCGDTWNMRLGNIVATHEVRENGIRLFPLSGCGQGRSIKEPRCGAP